MQSRTIAGRIAYVDSGSDFVIAIQCAKGVLDILRGLLTEFWEKFKDSSFEDFDKKMDSISKGLTVVAMVDKQVKDGVITAEDGTNLTHRVMSEMKVLATIGVSLPEDEITVTINQRQLLTDVRAVRLLGDGNPPDEKA